MFKLTIKNFFVIIVGVIGILIIFKAMFGDFEGAILDWANLQIPFWVGFPSGIIIIGIILYSLFKNHIDYFINNFDLSGGKL